MDTMLFRRKVILGVGACAVAAGVWYLSRQECTCEDCQEEEPEASVYVVENSADWRVNCEEIVSEVRHSKVVAMDCEWVSSGEDAGGRGKVALLQLAASPSWVALIRLCKLRTVPEELAQLLKDPSIVKIGVAVLEDAAKLLEDYKVQVNGCLDLRHMALATANVKRQLVEAGASLSLASMTEVLLENQLTKDIEIRCSDWECFELSDEQIHYASYDVVCAYGLAEKIACSNDWVTRFLGLILPSYLWLDSYLLSQYSEFIGIPFHRRQKKKNKRVRRFSVKTPSSSSASPASSAAEAHNKALRSYSARKTPLYDNCVLLCPDGELLCTCDERKARWYVERGLGEVLSTEPTLTVKLTFEPAQRAILDGDYYSTAKENICVVCGSKNDLIRKSVVPKEYRKHFPKIMKHHNAHDVVLTCVPCHSTSCIQDNALKEELAEHCDAPLTSSVEKYIENAELKAVRSAAMALMKNSSNLPADRHTQLESLLKKHFNVEDLTDDLIEEASKVDSKVKNKDYVSHGRKVVEWYATQGKGLIALETLWREHFLQQMKPKYLPALWSTDHHHEVLAVKVAFIRDCEPDEATVLMSRIGLDEQRVTEILTKLRDIDKVKVEKMNIQKGRLIENLCE